MLFLSFILFMILLIALWMTLLKVKNYTIDNFMSELGKVPYKVGISSKELKALEECQVPNLSTDKCYKSREFECPIVNGTFLQCTNNYIPQPTQYNADCGNRTFEMVPEPWKISENCYYNKIGFNREKKYGKVKYV